MNLPTLSNFFAPLNFLTLSYFVLLFIFFDVVGTRVKNLVFRETKSKLLEARIINWLLGFGVFIFFWFLASLAFPYTKNNILISIFGFLLLSLPGYFKNKDYLEFFVCIKKSILPLLIIVPFLPALFVKASLPPYYGDEMAYHYIPPQALLDLASVKYVGGLYADLPRNLNLFWEIVFSLTKTYSIARLFHFTILASALVFAFQILKKNFGFIAGLLFVFFFLSIPQDIILTSTLGYIDVGAYSFLLIALVSLIDFFLNKKSESLYLVIIFWALNLGTKYTGVSNFVSLVVAFVAIAWWKRKEFRNTLNTKILLKGAFLFIVFGGYWYVKNFILYGNPIFPFIFNCWGTHVEPCPQTGGFFGDWTTKISLENANLILSQLIARNLLLRVGCVLAVIGVLFVKDKKVKIIGLLLTLTVFFEILILKGFSGFYVRYHQHIQLYVIILFVIIFTSTFKSKVLNLLKNACLLLTILSCLYFYSYTILTTNSLKFLNWTEITYAIGRINIYDWLRFNFSKMNDVILWCDGGEGKEYVNLARFDPELIWFSHDGLMRVFLIRCRYNNPNIDTSSLEKIVPSAIANKQSFWIASTAKCVRDDKVVKNYFYEQDYQYDLRKIDNKIICNSMEKIPNLYYFDSGSFSTK